MAARNIREKMVLNILEDVSGRSLDVNLDRWPMDHLFTLIRATLRLPIGVFVSRNYGSYLQIVRSSSGSVWGMTSSLDSVDFDGQPTDVIGTCATIMALADGDDSSGRARSLFVTLETIVRLSYFVHIQKCSVDDLRPSENVSMRRMVNELVGVGKLSKATKDFIVEVSAARDLYAHTILRLSDIEIFDFSLDYWLEDDFRKLQQQYGIPLVEIWALFESAQPEQVDWDKFLMLAK